MTTTNATHTTNTTAALAAPWEEPDRPIVVGVDGSHHNWAAVYWALHQARRTGRPLDLVAAVKQHGDPTEREIVSGDWEPLDTLAEKIGKAEPSVQVRRVLPVGGAVPSLLAHSADAAMLVVGSRGLGAMGRVLLGSTSMGTASRAAVPVVVVPHQWPLTDQSRASNSDAPIVVGVDVDDPHPASLRYAFAEAARRHVHLHAIAAFEVPVMLSWDPAVAPVAYDSVVANVDHKLSAIVAPYCYDFPGVWVKTQVRHHLPAPTLLEIAKDAQLLVLGRHPGKVSGLPLSSVARTVLHHAETPVVLVPPT